MAQRTSFDKLQRDRAKKAKQALKRDRRQGVEGPEATTTSAAPPAHVDEGGELSAQALLALIEQIHSDLDAEHITFEEFEEKKADLLARLPID